MTQNNFPSAPKWDISHKWTSQPRFLPLRKTCYSVSSEPGSLISSSTSNRTILLASLTVELIYYNCYTGARRTDAETASSSATAAHVILTWKLQRRKWEKIDPLLWDDTMLYMYVYSFSSFLKKGKSYYSMDVDHVMY